MHRCKRIRMNREKIPDRRIGFSLMSDESSRVRQLFCSVVVRAAYEELNVCDSGGGDMQVFLAGHLLLPPESYHSASGKTTA
jgi:hypothetical protein